MRKMFIRVTVVALIGITGLFHGSRAQSQATYNLTLSRAEVSADGNGRTIVTMVARGDLSGILTLALNRRADGTVTGGEWALMVSYTTVTASDGQVSVGEPEGEVGNANGPEGAEALVQKGALKGDVAGGTLTLNVDGTLGSLNDIVLSLTGGTVAYGQVTSGNGLVAGMDLADRDASNGTASFTF